MFVREHEQLNVSPFHAQGAVGSRSKGAVSCGKGCSPDTGSRPFAFGGDFGGRRSGDGSVLRVSLLLSSPSPDDVKIKSTTPTTRPSARSLAARRAFERGFLAGFARGKSASNRCSSFKLALRVDCAEETLRVGGGGPRWTTSSSSTGRREISRLKTGGRARDSFPSAISGSLGTSLCMMAQE